MDSAAFWAGIRQRWWVIVVTAAVALVVAGLVSFFTTPVYSATAMIRVARAQTGTIEYADYMYGDKTINTLARVATSNQVLEELTKRLSFSTTARQLADQIKIKPVPDTELIGITVEDTSRAAAEEIAGTLAILVTSDPLRLYLGGTRSPSDAVSEQVQTVATSIAGKRSDLSVLQAATPTNQQSIAGLTKEIDALDLSYAGLLKQYNDLKSQEAIKASSVSIGATASASDKPVRPSWTMNLGAALVVGLLVGVVLAAFGFGSQARPVRVRP